MRVASVLWCVAVAACASTRPMQRPGGLSTESLAALVPECGERTVVALCAAAQCEVYWCHEVARHLAAHPPRANNGRVALPGALLSHLEPATRRSPSPVFFTRGAGEALPSAPPETVLTHPATVRLELALYALVRDTNRLFRPQGIVSPRAASSRRTMAR